MRARRFFPFILALLTMVAVQARAEEVVLRERLARLEEGQKALRELTDKRFDDMNRRFDDMNRRFDDLRFWLQIILGALVVIIGGLVAQWFLMWKRTIRLESAVVDRATEVDRVLPDQPVKEEITEVDPGARGSKERDRGDQDAPGSVRG